MGPHASLAPNPKTFSQQKRVTTDYYVPWGTGIATCKIYKLSSVRRKNDTLSF